MAAVQLLTWFSKNVVEGELASHYQSLSIGD